MRLESTAQIWGITGNLGGGKTLSAVEMAVRAIASDYFVVSNIDLRMDRVCSLLGERARSLYKRCDLSTDDPDSWPWGDPRGSGGSRRVLVILDEVAEWFDQYSGTSPQVRGFLSWLRHSSKRGQDVVLVVQRKEFLAKSLRILVARWVWVEDLAVWRMPGLRIRVPFCRGLVMRYVSDRLGNSIQPLEFASKSRWGQYYYTAQLLSGSMRMPYEVPPRVCPPAIPFARRFAYWYLLGWCAFRVLGGRSA